MHAARFLFILILVLIQLSSSLPEDPDNSDNNDDDDDDAESLLRFKSSLTNSRSLFSWKEGTLPCKDGWFGVFCIKGQDTIIRIHLPRMGLSGTLDVKALTQIHSLRTISLINNSFTGSLPNSFKDMSNLRALYLSGNRLSGVISNDFFSGMDSLTRLWLSNNNFTGNIPDSLGKLPHLNQLHLDNNQFSGVIPNISQKWVSDLDLSNNKLQGQVPETMMARFGEKAFGGNSGVCVGLECEPSFNAKDDGANDDDGVGHGSNNNNKKKNNSIMNTVDLMLCIVVVMLILLLANIDLKPKDKQETTHELSVFKAPLPNNNNNNDYELSAAASGRSRFHKKLGDESKKGIADLVIINEDRGLFGFADLMKAAAEVLGNNGGLGSSYKAVMDNGVSVVVKRIKDMNKLGKQAFDAEMKSLARIRHPNILTPLAYHYRKEEKLVISECISKGSLLYVMHGDRGSSHANLNWATRLKILKGIASGMKFLHQHEQFGLADLPHGNLKSSNVLLNDKYEVLINDHGFIPFLPVNQAKQGLFGFNTPEALQTNQVSPKSDVYCLGIIILEVITGKFPSEYLSGKKGGTNVIQWVKSAIQQGKEVELLDPDIGSTPSTESIKNMVQLLHLGANCTEIDPQQRPTMVETTTKIEEIQQ